MKKAALAIAMVLVLVAILAAQAPPKAAPAALPKPSPAVISAYNKAVVIDDMLKEARTWLSVVEKKQKEAIEQYSALVNKECPGCQFNPQQNAYVQTAAKE